MAGNLQKTVEDMDKRESNLFQLLDGHKDRSRKILVKTCLSIYFQVFRSLSSPLSH